MTNLLIDFISLLIIFSTCILLLVSQGRQSALMAINQVILSVGLLFSIVGVIGMLTNMSDPDAIGPAFAIACLTVLYSAAIKFLLSLYFMEKVSGGPMATDVSLPRRLMSYLLFVGLTLWCCQNSGGLLAFVDATTLLICVVLTGVSLFVLRLSGADNQWLVIKYLQPIGLLVFFMGLVGMIANVGNPKGVGPAMAMALLGLGYTCFIRISLVFLIPISVLPEPSNMQDSLWSGLGLAGLFLSFAALFISFS